MNTTKTSGSEGCVATACVCTARGVLSSVAPSPVPSATGVARRQTQPGPPTVYLNRGQKRSAKGVRRPANPAGPKPYTKRPGAAGTGTELIGLTSVPCPTAEGNRVINAEEKTSLRIAGVLRPVSRGTKIHLGSPSASPMLGKRVPGLSPGGFLKLAASVLKSHSGTKEPQPRGRQPDPEGSCRRSARPRYG